MSEKEKNRIDWFEVGDSGLCLSADRYCWKVGRRVVVARGEPRGEEMQYREVTFHPKLENCFKELLDRKIKSSDVESLKELLQAIRDAHEWLRGEFEAIEQIT